ncbi:uncharacterized protein BCR38DRAFT_458601 [Pseudomassariella vexata]|uniref:Ketosynthase family 3 (KS3) domain-containing protein n=1 Tax=Pseudomassariella vexata TaxID=1141098 RepID=A0A1Y2DW24_9PEZI|nr:uncharacterized protein BCR38DRAFT_458601 [Pseudomassariella vexata]ORY63490.1 hypothetical protein BCR38DRAFT_458601 [Pseudomassariella vexata]
MLFEIVYEGNESVGSSMQQLRGSTTAVLVGMMNSDCTHMLFSDPDDMPPYTTSGVALSVMANRVSYLFDWRGLSLVIDTACSSSIYWRGSVGKAQTATVAGTNPILGPEIFIAESKARRGRYDTLDYITFCQGIADNDHMRCIIRETGVNQDSRTSVPSTEAQATLVKATYAKCGLD